MEIWTMVPPYLMEIRLVEEDTVRGRVRVLVSQTFTQTDGSQIQISSPSLREK